MRILQLTPGTGHFICGSCLRDNSLVRGLRDLGHDVTMAPLYLPFSLEEPEEHETERVHMGGINMYLEQKLPLASHMPRWLGGLLDRPGLLRWASRHGHMTSPEDLGALAVSMLSGEEGRQARELEKLVEWLRAEERPEVLCLSNVMLAGMARSLKAALGVPVVCTLQGEAPFLDGLPEPWRGRAWATLRERAADVDAFIAVSGWYGELMGERLGLVPECVRVVHNGIDVRDFDTAEVGPPAAPTVGFLARMCADKGLPVLIEAFLELRRRLPGARLRVAGVVLAEDRPLVEQVRARLAEAGAGEAVELLPNLSRGEKIAFLRTLSVLSVPATYGESFGLYVLEALAAGVPVVQPRSGAFPEVLAATGGGVLCEPDDPGDLAAALERLLGDEAGAREMAARGRDAVRERFTLERMARGVVEVCKRAAAS